MSAPEIAAMLRHADEFLASARADRQASPPRRNVGFDNARTAAELAGKALLLARTGDYPRKGGGGHNIGGLLFQNGLVPDGVEPKRLARLLREHTRGDYGFMKPVSEGELDEALRIAEAVLASAKAKLGSTA